MSDGAGAVTVVDTNVPVVANGNSEAGSKCVRRCVGALRDLIASGRIAIDDGWRIIGEYRNNLSETGQPGVGDRFFLWTLRIRNSSERCVLVPITSVGDNREDYAEFPRDPALSGFDPSDRKFVAVAVAVDGRASILQAVDTKWWLYRDALTRPGVDVCYLCKEEVSEIPR